MKLLNFTASAALAAGLLIQGPAFGASVGKGKAAYMKHGCWQCHGFAGQGGAAGPRLAPGPMPMAAMSAFVRNSARAMPPYTKAVLSEEDLTDIHAYLESVPKAADYKTIPLLSGN